MKKTKAYKKARKELVMKVRYFFLNNPADRTGEVLWELYSQWVHSADSTTPKQHSEMLLFCEYLGDLIVELNQADQVLQSNNSGHE